MLLCADVFGHIARQSLNLTEFARLRCVSKTVYTTLTVDFTRRVERAHACTEDEPDCVSIREICPLCNRMFTNPMMKLTYMYEGFKTRQFFEHWHGDLLFDIRQPRHLPRVTFASHLHGRLTKIALVMDSLAAGTYILADGTAGPYDQGIAHVLRAHGILPE